MSFWPILVACPNNTFVILVNDEPELNNNYLYILAPLVYSVKIQSI